MSDDNLFLQKEAPTAVGTPEPRVETLRHGTRAGVTAGVYRVAGSERSSVLKVISSGRDDPEWAESQEPSANRYWKRELLLYERGIWPEYADAGFRMPTLYERFDRDDETVALWLEDVQGVPGTEWDLPRYGITARRLGRAQGSYMVSPRTEPEEWFTTSFLPEHLASWSGVDWSLLDNDDAWATPLARLFPEGLRDAMSRLHVERERFLGWMDALPRALCHLDFWPANMFDDGKKTVIIDWSFAGLGAIGEDIGNWIPDSIFDLWRPAELLPKMEETVFESYCAGLRDAGWDGDRDVARLGMCASAIKYEWLTPYMLAMATDPEHEAYGAAAESVTLYRERGRTLAFLAGWAEEARRLAPELL